MLVYLMDDNTQKNQYVFSVSTYKGLTELHFFDENGNNSYKAWRTTSFFDLDSWRYIFSYQFSLIEGSSNIYYAVYVQYEGSYTDSSGQNHDFSVSYTISKFKYLFWLFMTFH